MHCSVLLRCSKAKLRSEALTCRSRLPLSSSSSLSLYTSHRLLSKLFINEKTQSSASCEAKKKRRCWQKTISRLAASSSSCFACGSSSTVRDREERREKERKRECLSLLKLVACEKSDADKVDLRTRTEREHEQNSKAN